MASNINHLEPYKRFGGDDCQVVMNSIDKMKHRIDTHMTCDEAAAEINKQLIGR